MAAFQRGKPPTMFTFSSVYQPAAFLAKTACSSRATDFEHQPRCHHHQDQHQDQCRLLSHLRAQHQYLVHHQVQRLLQSHLRPQQRKRCLHKQESKRLFFFSARNSGKEEKHNHVNTVHSFRQKLMVYLDSL